MGNLLGWLVGLGLMAATLGSNFLRVTSHFMDAAMCVFFSISQMSFEAFCCCNGMSTQGTRRLVII